MEVSFKDQENEVIKEMIKRKYFGFQSSLSCLKFDAKREDGCVCGLLQK